MALSDKMVRAFRAGWAQTKLAAPIDGWRNVEIMKHFKLEDGASVRCSLDQDPHTRMIDRILRVSLKLEDGRQFEFGRTVFDDMRGLRSLGAIEVEIERADVNGLPAYVVTGFDAKGVKVELPARVAAELKTKLQTAKALALDYMSDEDAETVINTIQALETDIDSKTEEIWELNREIENLKA